METCPSTIPKHSLFDVKILNDETAGNLTTKSSSSATVGAETTQLHICTKFKDFFPDTVELGQTSSTSRENVDPSIQWINYRVKVYGASTKPSAFKQIRRKWCAEICKPGDPFWLESLESNSTSYQYKSKEQVHRIPSFWFGLGSFADRSTFIEHYNTNSDCNYVERQGIYSSFEHDISKLTLTITLKRPYETDGTKFRLEFEYKQFEDYILVDQETQTIDLYIPLIRPPIVKKDAVSKDTNILRCVKFLSCSRDVLGNSSVLKLHCAYSDQEERGPMELIARLSQNRKIYFAAVQTTQPRLPSQVPTKPSLMDFKADYALECLLSRGFKVTDRVTSGFYEILQSSLDTHEVPQICRALYQLIAYVDSDRFCHLETKLQQLLYGTFKKNVEIEFEVPKHYAHVPRIIVTPTQDYLVQPELVSENRVIRQYGHEFAMRIAFRDEDFNKLMSFGDSLKDVLRTRVVDLLKNGVRICGRHFQFLACSNSQLRDHGAWLYAKRDDGMGVEKIRESLGQLNNIRCVATYVSRMGQCFSSTKESVKVSIPEGVLIKEIPDITVKYENVKFECCGETRSGEYIFSDGVGKISEALAKKVAESLGLQSTPSAYQIRYGGCKGMLAIDKKIPGGDWKDVVCLRKSMKKFQSEHKDLEICEYSKPNFLYLNRQCITLLSGLGVQDEAFIKLQDAMLMRLASMLLSEKVALDMIGRANVAGGMKTSYLRDSGIVVTHEPFFRSMLLAIYKARLNDLIRKARIAIPQSYGRLMVGVLDETGKLEYGQVFIRYTKEIGGDGTEKELITRKGPVMITKNPCFHPGDMRKLEAVDIQSLNHLVDCIVFPAKGPRPHTDEISGSDLDGDKYFVTWYEPFLRGRGKNVNPMDFAAPKKKELDRSVDVNDMIEFIAEYVKNDQLGIIANAHLVHADSEEKGIKSEKCIKLAHMHSDAVDFPKTGKCPSLTQDLRPEQYPDFMMKVDKPRYRSTKVLGKLFQKCKQLERARHFISNESITPAFTVDQDLILEGHQRYLRSATEKRDYYNTKLGSLMALYGLKNEGEVITGCLMKVSSRLSGKTDERFEIAQLIQASVASLRSKLKEDFYDEFGGQKKIEEKFKSKKKYPDNVLLKASAWYAATYNAEGGKELANQSRDEWSLSDTPLLSFPWVVARLLAHIKKNVLEKHRKNLKQSASDGSKDQGPTTSNTERENIDGATQKIKKTPSDTSEAHELRDISEVVTRQAENFFIEGGYREKMVVDLEMRQEERNRVYDVLCRRSGKTLPTIPILGVALTGLNIMDPKLQSLELYIHAGWKAKEKTQVHYLESLELHSLERNGLNSQTTHKDLKISITADSNKMRKTMYVFLHIQKCPHLLHLLLVIMHWARRRHLIGSRQESFMEVENLAVLFIRFCETKKYIESLKIPDVNTRCKEFLSGAGLTEAEENWKEAILEDEMHPQNGFLNGAKPGLALIKFLEHYAIDSDLDTLHISKLKCVKNPINPGQFLFPDLNAKQIQRFSDAALHGFHEIAQCRGLDSILKSVEQENKDVQESLTLPRCSWNTIRGAEDFVACGFSEATGAKVSIRQGDRGGQIFMEIHGNYTSLAKCQDERKNLEKRLKGVSVYKSTINGACHFIFLGQSTDSDPVTVKKLEKNFAVNLKRKPSRSGQDEKKLQRALTDQLRAFNKHYVTLLHGPNKLEMTVEFGSIYIKEARAAWIESGITVKNIENMLTQFSTAEIQGNSGKRGPNSVTSKVLFFESRIKTDNILEDLCKSLASLGKMLHLKTSKNYVVHLKNDKGIDAHFRMVFDKELKFERFQFEPFKWLVADLKTYRPSEATSRDIDFRFTMTSTRDLEAERAQELSIYETFAKKEILTKVNDTVKISEDYRNLVASVQLVKVDVYKVDCKGSQIFVDVKTTKEFNAKKHSESSTLGLRGSVDSNDIDKTREITRNLLSASKMIGPLI